MSSGDPNQPSKASNEDHTNSKENNNTSVESRSKDKAKRASIGEDSATNHGSKKGSNKNINNNNKKSTSEIKGTGKDSIKLKKDGRNHGKSFYKKMEYIDSLLDEIDVSY